MTVGTVTGTLARKRVFSPDFIRGIVVEVRDLAATRAFYSLLFQDASGVWHEADQNLIYRSGPQRIEFVRRSQPLTLGHTGQHQAYSVRADRLPALAEALAAAGHAENWWREDHPGERTVTAYVSDPSANRVQLVASGGDGPLLRHAALEVHDLELAELFYVKSLGGKVDYCHGWAMDDYAEAKAWGEGKDPCAPWTRRFDVRYWDKLRIARPNMQLFVRFGSTVLGLILATEHRQEPPEEVLRGTPRLILQTAQPVGEVAAYLSSVALPFEAEDRSLFLRDPGGNYVELDCTRSG